MRGSDADCRLQTIAIAHRRLTTTAPDRGTTDRDGTGLHPPIGHRFRRHLHTGTVERDNRSMFSPKLQILAAPQRTLWAELAGTPNSFTLYRGTAIALRLGHRESVNFDFFSRRPFQPSNLLDGISYLAGGSVVQSAANTLTVRVDRSGPVMLSYFGGLRLGQVEADESVDGPMIPSRRSSIWLA